MKYAKSVSGKWHIVQCHPSNGYCGAWQKCKCGNTIWAEDFSETKLEGKMCKHCEMMEKNG